MNSYSVFLYISTVLIWGSTWIAITFQLGTVDPLASVIYRMGIASALLFALCKLRSLSLALTADNHKFIAFQGICLFGLNYWAIYHSELYLPSGIIAVIFSLIVFFNIINGRIFLKRPITINSVIGGIIGLTGLCMLFYPELIKFSASGDAIKGFLLAITAVFVASLGNIAATRNGLLGTSVWVINAWGTLYGTVALIIVALITGIEFSYENSLAYTASLLYLSVFGTILAFGAYLKLLVILGPEKAGYSGLMIPFFAILLSTVFEGYQWTVMAAIGFILVAAGNYLVMGRRPNR
ncbi:MAG: DMT family transporter [Porticoccaceae bacterium]|jgi:drug/metabolite transporter (DMT)-like permease|nr:DMT family transporter [Porticoccaceae bacterium]MBT5578402.1 DMT family transporter [Porticoccaceae bacterium]MBT7375156.1 DMT family transporter [Porticoccaceae bacterium]